MDIIIIEILIPLCNLHSIIGIRSSNFPAHVNCSSIDRSHTVSQIGASGNSVPIPVHPQKFHLLYRRSPPKIYTSFSYSISGFIRFSINENNNCLRIINRRKHFTKRFDISDKILPSISLEETILGERRGIGKRVGKLTRVLLANRRISPPIADASVTMPVRNGDRKRLKKVDVTFDDEKFHAFLSFPFAPAKKRNDINLDGETIRFVKAMYPKWKSEIVTLVDTKCVSFIYNVKACSDRVVISLREFLSLSREIRRVKNLCRDGERMIRVIVISTWLGTKGGGSSTAATSSPYNILSGIFPLFIFQLRISIS